MRTKGTDASFALGALSARLLSAKMCESALGEEMWVCARGIGEGGGELTAALVCVELFQFLRRFDREFFNCDALWWSFDDFCRIVFVFCVAGSFAVRIKILIGVV